MDVDALIAKFRMALMALGCVLLFAFGAAAAHYWTLARGCR